MKKVIGLIFAALYLQVSAQCPSGRYDSEIATEFDSVKVVYGSAVPAQSTTPIDLVMDVYTPKGDTMAKRPLIIFCHGGSFISGTRNDYDVKYLSRAFAKRGYTTATIDYRLGLDGFPPDAVIMLRSAIRAVQDGKAAVRYFYRSVIENGNPYNIDTNKIYIGGSSAGALLSLHLAYLDKDSEFTEIGTQGSLDSLGGLEGNSGNPGFSTRVHGVINLCGALAKKEWLEPGNVPFISMHGTDDATVPYKSGYVKVSTLNIILVDGSYVIDSFAKTINVSSQLFTWQGAGHVPYVTDQKAMDSTVAFVSRNVKGWVCNSISARPQDPTLAQEVRLFPNPANNQLFVELGSAASQNCVISLLNVHGQEVFRMNTQGQETIRIPREDLSNGLYVLQLVTQDNRQYTRKFIFE
ncbi:MAG: T9SS type A sorting domain-containing protein [Bacteroidia bacterium]|nr:T9SS type A sorting domain-containing protein [Bacteroidia bacterium]